MLIGPNNDLIFHHIDRQNYTISNITLEGHTYHPGQVVHRLTLGTGLSFSWSSGFYMREGAYLTTTGTGLNTNWATATGNYVAGKLLFQRTHYMAPRLMQQYLGVP